MARSCEGGTGQARAQGWGGEGRCKAAPGPRPPATPGHRISWASSTHFQCSTGLSFSRSTVSNCCSPARSAGPPAGTKKTPGAHDPLRGPGSFASTVTLDKDRSPASSSVNKGLTSGVLRKDLEGRLPFAFISSLPADPVLADLSAAHLPARPPPSPGPPTLREPFLAARLKAKGAPRSPHPSFSS